MSAPAHGTPVFTLHHDGKTLQVVLLADHEAALARLLSVPSAAGGVTTEASVGLSAEASGPATGGADLPDLGELRAEALELAANNAKFVAGVPVRVTPEDTLALLDYIELLRFTIDRLQAAVDRYHDMTHTLLRPGTRVEGG